MKSVDDALFLSSVCLLVVTLILESGISMPYKDECQPTRLHFPLTTDLSESKQSPHLAGLTDTQS